MALIMEDCAHLPTIRAKYYLSLSGLRITNATNQPGLWNIMVSTGDNPDEYAWQTNPPNFFKFKPRWEYNVAVRDNLDGQELSTVNKVVSMPHITSFEAVIPMNKTVGIYKVNEEAFSVLIN